MSDPGRPSASTGGDEREAQAAHAEDQARLPGPEHAETSADRVHRKDTAPFAATAGERVSAEPAERATRKWYIVHTYSGFEERVKETLRQRAEALDMGDAFGEIRIPTETVVEYKGGKKRETQRKFFPGYILVEMEMSDAAWHVVKNTPKVTGFVGTGRKPTPLSQDEVDKILEQVVTAKEKPKPKYVFERAEPVRITDGPFNNFTGVVDDVNLDRNTLKVMVTIFGRQTPVELDFSQVQKI
jgi:transcription termination/antitermination protein NusG